jgi:hypothetical protein
MIDNLYKDMRISFDFDCVISLLNGLLLQINYNKINDLHKFNVIYGDLTKIDIDKFIDNYLETLHKIDIDAINLFKYKKRRPQKIIIDVINIIANCLNYKTEKFFSTKKKNNAPINVIKYRLIKIE